LIIYLSIKNNQSLL